MHQLRNTYFPVKQYLANVRKSGGDSIQIQIKRIVNEEFGEQALRSLKEQTNAPFIATFEHNGVAHGINYCEIPSKNAAASALLPVVWPEHNLQYLVFIATDIATKRVLST